MFQPYKYLLACVTLTALTVTGCATNQTANNVTSPQYSTTNAVPTNTTVSNGTQLSNSTTPSGTVSTAPSNTTPMEIDAVPGAMFTRQRWPLEGTNPSNVGTGMFVANYSSSGPTIGGVHWTWPSSDTNPKDYVVVPATIGGKPYLVWCHLAPQMKLGKPENGSAGYSPNQLEPTGPSQMGMTPWITHGGSLNNGATLITNDIPPVWSVGHWAFPKNLNDVKPESLAGSAWTGWFQWGNTVHPYTVPAPKPPVEPTVAVPNGLYPAYNGVVLGVRTQVLGGNQGGATNLFYLNLANHHIEGLASLTSGGGLFSAMRVISGMVFTGEATDLMANGNTKAVAYVYNEVAGQRTPVESSTVMSQNNGFSDWVINGSKVYDANNKLVADLNLPASVTTEPSASTFGVSTK